MTDLQKILELIEEKEKAGGCAGCAFCDRDEWDMPCAKCKRNVKDYWRPETIKSEG